METVLVTGGTGHLGRHIVGLLKPTHRLRVLARSPGFDPGITWIKGDLATGEGIADAVHGADIIVHAATFSPMAQRGYPVPRDFRHSPPDVDVDGTTLLLDEAVRAGVRHFVYVSITGVDRPPIAYLRLKHTAEELVSSEELPWSILRATQFYWLLDLLLSKFARLPVMPIPSNVNAQPVDAKDFAAHIAERVREGPTGRRDDFGGPETVPMSELVREWFRARQPSSRLVTMPLPARMRDGAQHLLTAPGGQKGTTTWAEWLREHPAP